MKRLSAFVPLGIAAGLFLTTDCMNKRQLHTKDNVLNSRTEKNADDIRVLKSQNEELFDRINQRLEGIENQVFEIREMVRELHIQIDRELEHEEDLEMESCNRNFESSTNDNLNPTAESSDSILNFVVGAPPNNSSNCPIEDILVGTLVRSFDPLLALEV